MVGSRAPRGRWSRPDTLWLLAGLAVVGLAAAWVAVGTAARLFTPGMSDSYLRQALAWRDGRIALPQDYPWLELAVYQGEYYVSFPPVPTVPIWLLTFLFGKNVPSGLVTLVYFLASYAVLFLLARRYLPRWQAAAVAVFVCLGGSLLDIAVSGETFSGGSWYQAQLLALLLTALAFYLVDGRGRWRWAVGLVCIALAVGCRPFNAVYVPVLLWMLYRNVRRRALWPSLLAMVPYVIVPLLIACAYGAYNAVRFGNPLEFGHAYLPELQEAGEPMFMVSAIWRNFVYILRPPFFDDGLIVFPVLFGFAVYLTNPMILLAGGQGIARAARREGDVTDALLGATLLIHALLLLMHRTNGGWQYGTRYLCDLLAALLFLLARGREGLRRWMLPVMAALVAFNIYGTIIFHWL